LTSGLSTSLPIHLCSMTEDIQHACEHGLCSLRLSKYGHSPNYISGSTNHDIDVEGRLVKFGNDIWSPKLSGNSNCSLNANSFHNSPSNKIKTFIETKVTAMKLQGFNL